MGIIFKPIEWIKRKIMNVYIASIVRTTLAALAGFLVANNILPAELVDAFLDTNTALITGLIVWLMTQGWSLMSKKKEVEEKKELKEEVVTAKLETMREKHKWGN